MTVKLKHVQTVFSVGLRCMELLRLFCILVLADCCIISHNVMEIDFNALYDGAVRLSNAQCWVSHYYPLLSVIFSPAVNH